MSNLLIPVRDSGELLSYHMDRLQQSRGSFGNWRSKLLELSPRWQWYSLLLLNKRVPQKPWPQINFVDDHDRKAWRLIDACLKPYSNIRLDDFLHYILHCLGYEPCRQLPEVIQADHLDHWDKTFHLPFALSLERDLFGDYMADSMGKQHRDGTGFFATPMSVSMMMAKMTLTGADLFSTVMDPCVGSGRLLLASSSFSFCLSGQDINMTCVRATLANGIFAPQIFLPPPPETIANYKGKIRKIVIPRETLLRLSAELREDVNGGSSFKCV
jgi:hypothetical protein